MVTVEKRKKRSELREALQRLTYGLGVQRQDLLDALEGDLSPLKECWEVSLKGGIDVVRATITENLRRHVSNLDVPRSTAENLTAEQKAERFRNSVQVSFNATRKYWPNLDLKGRHAWLEDEAPTNLKLSVSTSRRYLENALDQIEQQILASGYAPVVPDRVEVDTQEPIAAQSPQDTAQTLDSPTNGGLVEISPDRVGSPPTPRPRRIRRIVLTGAAAFSLVAAILAWSPFGDDKDNDPVKVVAVNQIDTGDNSWVFPTGRAFSTKELAALDNSEYDKYSGWFKSRGAAPAGRRADQITLEGNSSKPVEIDDMQVEKKCQKPYSGTYFDNPNAGQSDSIVMYLDMDEQIPTVTDGSEKPYFPRYTVSLKKGERTKIVVMADAYKFACTYTLKFEVLVGDEKTTLLVTDNGKPFALSGKLDGYSKYSNAYIGGVANMCEGSLFRKVDPKTYTADDAYTCP